MTYTWEIVKIYIDLEKGERTLEISKKTLKSIFLGVIGCIVLYWLLIETERVKTILRVIKSVVSPFFVGASFAFVINVPMRSIEGLLRKIKNGSLRRAVAILLTVILVLLVLTLVFWLLVPQLIETVQTLIPKLYTFFSNLEAWFKNLMQDNPELMKWITDNTDFENLDWAGLAQRLITMLSNSLTTIVSGAFLAIGSVSSFVMNLFISVVFAIYCLFQKENLARQGRKLLYAFLPERFSDEIIRILRLSNATFSNFLSGQGIEVCILGTLFAVSMAIFRMPYIPLVSVLVATTAFIPIVGAWVGCILGTFFIFVANPLQAVWFVVMFLVLQQIENNMIYPRVVGTSIGLSGMWVLVAVSVGGNLMGVAGMFLMIPVTSVLYTILREYTAKRLVARNIDGDKIREHPPELKSKFRERREKKKEQAKKK